MSPFRFKLPRKLFGLDIVNDMLIIIINVLNTAFETLIVLCDEIFDEVLDCVDDERGLKRSQSRI